MAEASPLGTDLLASPVRRRVVALLADLPHTSDEPLTPSRSTGLTAAEVGARVGLHGTTARFHLERLVEAGVLMAGFHRHGTGRPHKRYAVAPEKAPTSGPADAYRMLAELLTEALAPQAAGGALSPEAAGSRWAHQHVRALGGVAGSELPQARTAGQWLAKMGMVLDLLDSWGYEPSLRTADRGRAAEIALGRCPFLELAEAHTQVVCAAHRGVLRGTLDVLGEPDTDVRIEPFVAPATCMAHVATRAVLTLPRGREATGV